MKFKTIYQRKKDYILFKTLFFYKFSNRTEFNIRFSLYPKNRSTRQKTTTLRTAAHKNVTIQIQIYVCFGVSCAGKQWLKAESRIRIKPITAGPQQSDNVSGVMHQPAAPSPHRSRTAAVPLRCLLIFRLLLTDIWIRLVNSAVRRCIYCVIRGAG